MLFLLLTASVLAEKWGDLDKLENYRGKSEGEPWLRVKCRLAVMNPYGWGHCMVVPEGTACNAKGADDYQYPGVCKKDPAVKSGYARHMCYNAELPLYKNGMFTTTPGNGYFIPGSEAEAMKGNRPEQLSFWTGKWWAEESAEESVGEKWGDLDKLENYRGKSEWEPWLRVKCGFAVMNTYDCFHCMAVPEGTACNAKGADDYQYPGVCKKDPAVKSGYGRHMCYNAELPLYKNGIFTTTPGKGYNIPGAEAEAMKGNRPEQLDFWTGKWWA